MAISGSTEGLETLQYADEPVLPDKDSYSVQIPGGVVTSNLPGGLPKSQIQFFNGVYTVGATYVGLDGFKINYLENFFKRTRGQKFIARLAVDYFFEDFIVQVQGEPIASKTGFNGSISVKYSVEPSVDRELEKLLYDWGQNAGHAGNIWRVINKGIQALPGE